MPENKHAQPVGRIFIGTSGWVYKEWANDFYQGLKPREHFAHYARQFPTVEINASFYRLPALPMVHGWRGKAPAGFIFAVKGSRFITHIKRLNHLGRSVDVFLRRIRPLREKLGPLLWQLPPNFQPDQPRLEKFLRRLPGRFQHAIEFRHPAWLTGETFARLQAHRAAAVWISSQRMPANYTRTANFVYLRFHGLAGGPRHDYTRQELEPWAEQLRKETAAGRDAYVYFNNDLNVRAPNNARLLMEICGAAAVQAG